MVPRHRSWGVPLGELEQFYEGFDGNLVDFSGVKSLKTVHLCCSMGDVWIKKYKKDLPELKHILCTLLVYSMYTVFQFWKMHQTTYFCSILNSMFGYLTINIVYTHMRTYMHIYICVYTCICAYLGGETHT